jgi:2-deoxy-D-gluconate 3-dehydrogenase
LKGKVAVVTGGSRGLGLGMAEGLAAAGVKTVVVARGKPRSPRNDLAFVEADLMDAGARKGLIERIAKEFGGVDILVHAAGQQHRQAFVDFPLVKFNEILELHVTAGFDLAQQAARLMLPKKAGKIVFVSSILSFQGGLMIPAYAAAKHAIAGLVKALTNELAPHGINVNAIAPGYFDAGVGQEVVRDPVRGPAILARIPAGRTGQPEDLAGAVLFLASDWSRYVHGQTLAVDGGWLAR